MNGKNKFLKQDSKGFTLVELLVTLSIIALLVSLVGPVLFKHLAPAKRSIARAQMEIFMSALDSYFMDVGKYPSAAEGLESLRVMPPNNTKWQGPYLKKDVPADPWESSYIYRVPGRNGGFEIISLGADGNEGGKDEDADINSWENSK